MKNPIIPCTIIFCLRRNIGIIGKGIIGFFSSVSLGHPVFHKVKTEFKKPAENEAGEDVWEHFMHWYNETYNPITYNNIYDFEDKYSRFQADYEKWVEEEERKGSQIKLASIHRVA
jgi:hypothetical protein